MDQSAPQAHRGQTVDRIYDMRSFGVGRVLAILLGILLVPTLANASEARRTALVRAVEGARDAIVNIRG